VRAAFVISPCIGDEKDEANIQRPFNQIKIATDPTRRKNTINLEHCVVRSIASRHDGGDLVSILLFARWKTLPNSD
jgi:hypothetical protein